MLSKSVCVHSYNRDKGSSYNEHSRKGTSSTCADFLVSEVVAEAEDIKSERFVASLDARKAFDVVYQTTVLHKLFYSGLDPALWILVQKMYQNAPSKVKW